MCSGTEETLVFYGVWSDCGAKNIGFYIVSGIPEDEYTVKSRALGTPGSPEAVKHECFFGPRKHRKTRGLGERPLTRKHCVLPVFAKNTVTLLETRILEYLAQFLKASECILGVQIAFLDL